MMFVNARTAFVVHYPIGLARHSCISTNTTQTKQRFTEALDWLKSILIIIIIIIADIGNHMKEQINGRK